MAPSLGDIEAAYPDWTLIDEQAFDIFGAPFFRHMKNADRASTDCGASDTDLAMAWREWSRLRGGGASYRPDEREAGAGTAVGASDGPAMSPNCR